MVREDRNFDDLADRLKRRIYGSPKGKLRIELVWEDLDKYILSLPGSKKKLILDAGGGFGQISIRLARLGHDIVICDISKKMLDEAEKAFKEEGLLKKLTIINNPFQKLPEKYKGSFDLVLSHAVLEWLAEPEISIKVLTNYIKPEGFMSVLFYNLNALIHQNAIKGNFHKVLSESYSDYQKGLTPFNPLLPDDVNKWLNDENFNVISKTGIRVFYDFMNRKIHRERTFEDVMKVEKMYCRHEPFASLGKYIHFIAKNDLK